MPEQTASRLINNCYLSRYGAEPALGHAVYVARSEAAALGFTRAGAAPLFLEQYLDVPVEAIAAQVFGRSIERSAIVEIGNLASNSAPSMIALWGATANDLGSGSEIAAATLTAPLRRMFARIGLPIVIVASARPERLGASAARWGSYYEQDPQVCLGEIAAGQRAMAAWRRARKAGLAA